MGTHLRLTLATLLLMLASGICFAQDAKTIAAERDFQRYDGNKRLRTEPNTYPQLTLKHGKNREGVIEARFSKR